MQSPDHTSTVYENELSLRNALISDDWCIRLRAIFTLVLQIGGKYPRALFAVQRFCLKRYDRSFQSLCA